MSRADMLSPREAKRGTGVRFAIGKTRGGNSHPVLILSALAVFILSTRPSMPPGEALAQGTVPHHGLLDFCWVCWSIKRSGGGGARIAWLRRDNAQQKAVAA
jgi:hypothetical protein